MKKNIDLGNGMLINEDIDIANGQFGYDALWNGIQEKEWFIRLINKMLTWKTDGEGALIPNPVDFITTNKILQDTFMINILNNSETAIITNTGSLNMTQVNKNLYGDRDTEDK
jgi:hypothetical protein